MAVRVLLNAILVANFQSLVLVVPVAAVLVAVKGTLEPGALMAQAV